MTALKGFISVFCTLCCTLGGLFILSPKGSFEKPVRYVFALTVLLCTLTSIISLTKLDLNLNTQEFEISDISQFSKGTAEAVFKTALVKENVTFKKIEVITDKLENGSINITKVTVFSDEDPEKIKEIISPDGTLEVEVINE